MIFKFEILVHCYETNIFFVLLTIRVEQITQYLIEDGIWKSCNKIRINTILYTCIERYNNPLESDLANFACIYKCNEHTCNSIIVCFYLFINLKAIHFTFNGELE